MLNYERMTSSQVFNVILGRLLKQKGFGTVMGSCRYLTPEGNRCAVGVLLPDLGLTGEEEHWRGTLARLVEYGTEGCGSSKLMRGADVLKPLKSHLQILGMIQFIHDNLIPFGQLKRPGFSPLHLVLDLSKECHDKIDILH